MAWAVILGRMLGPGGDEPKVSAAVSALWRGSARRRRRLGSRSSLWLGVRVAVVLGALVAVYLAFGRGGDIGYQVVPVERGPEVADDGHRRPEPSLRPVGRDPS